jgi:hypothetical protein
MALAPILIWPVTPTRTWPARAHWGRCAATCARRQSPLPPACTTIPPTWFTATGNRQPRLPVRRRPPTPAPSAPMTQRPARYCSPTPCFGTRMARSVAPRSTVWYLATAGFSKHASNKHALSRSTPPAIVSPLSQPTPSTQHPPHCPTLSTLQGEARPSPSLQGILPHYANMDTAGTLATMCRDSLVALCHVYVLYLRPPHHKHLSGWLPPIIVLHPIVTIRPTRPPRQQST